MMGSNASRITGASFGMTPPVRSGLAILLAVAMAGANTLSGFAQAPQAADPSMVAAQVKKFGVGKSVKVTLIGGEKLNGHIQSISAESFTITINKAGSARAIPYNQVVEIKDPGPIFWILVGAALVIVIIVAAKR